MFNFVADYTHKYFGIDIGYNIVDKRFQDAPNVLALPALANLNAGIYGNINVGKGQILKVGIQGRNLQNDESLVNIAGASDTDTVLLRNQGVASQQGALAHGYLQLPRRIMVHVSYNF